MSQYDFGTIDPQVRDGTWLADALNQWRDSLYSMNSGNAAPAYVVDGLVWRDVSAGSAITTYKLRDGGADRPLFTVDATGLVQFANTFPVSGGTITGDLTVNGAINGGSSIIATGNVQGGNLYAGTGTGSPSVYLNGAAGVSRSLRYQTAGVARWTLYADTAAESGSNAGSNLILAKYTDAGAATTAFSVNRASGLFTIASGLVVSAGGINLAGGGAVLGSVTGGDKGTGTINMSGSVYVDGASVLTKENLVLDHASSVPIIYLISNGIGYAGGQIRFRNGAADRWYIYGSVAEAGSDSGSNLYFRRFTDAGAGSNLMELQRIMVVQVNGGMIVGAASGGNKGTGTINASAGFYDNGVRLSTTSYAKAWVRFSTNGTIVADAGVSSVVRNSAGKFTITFSPALPSANYAVSVTPHGTETLTRWVSVVSQTTTTLVVQFISETGAANDANASVIVFN